MRETRAVKTAAGLAAVLCLAAVAPAPLTGAVEPDRSSPAAEKRFRHPDLDFRALPRRPSELPGTASAAARQTLEDLGLLGADTARVDLRGGRFSTLLPAHPLLPVDTTGNHPSRTTPTEAEAVWDAFTDYLATRSELLRLDPGELSSSFEVTVHGQLVQIHAAREVDGVRVRGASVSATLRQGNLILLGARRWGDVDVPTRPTLTAERAMAIARGFLAPLEMTGTWDKTGLELLPMAAGHDPRGVAPGGGYRHRLVWVLRPILAGESGRWELLVDAHDGDLIAFDDTTRYATARRVEGGVYPLSNDGLPPGGLEEAGWPMPFDILTTSGDPRTTDGGGNAPICLDGDVTSKLSGAFVRMIDSCGAIGLTSAGDLDFGASAGTDCATPGFGGAGNTHSSRTGFHQLNRIKEQARGQLPGNAWLAQRLTSNVNLSPLCQASWNGATVNFYCSVPSSCANTGELAGVIDHEFGHGLDDNDANATISSPGEGFADVIAYLRSDDSCIGRGFRLGVNCTGDGDPCIACDGVRDIDYSARASGLPHDIAWIDANCPAGGGGPCGGGVHCEGSLTAESIFDLINTDLPGLFGMDHNTALEAGTRLTYLASGAVVDWFTCDVTAPFYGGCSADGGYLNFLAADDDNGDLNDGTPHMSAIFAAFDRHGIACDTPAVVDSGCAATPAAAPVVASSALDRAVSLSWGAVAGATEYRIVRADGVSACASGKIVVGTTTGTSFVDAGLQNGRDYSYAVVPIGAADSCIGPASACVTATPAAAANLAIDETSGLLSILSIDDGDPFFDNCEVARYDFDLSNIGSGSLTNVRIVSVTSPSHPGISFLTSFPAAVSPSTLAQCDSGTASITLVGGGLAFGDLLELAVEVTADELPVSKTASFFVDLVESDFAALASHTFSYESDLEQWQVTSGTFDRTDSGGGALGSSFYLASSAGLANRCDVSRSPLLRLSASSTLEVHTEYDIEDLCVFPFCFFPTWFDRANVGLRQAASGVRTPVSPDGGRLYNASGPYGPCGTAGQDGWAGTEITWGASSFSAAALGAAGLAGEVVQLDIRYGTDTSFSGQGLHFDEVTLTDFDLRVADTQSDLCAPTCSGPGDCDDTLYCNGVEDCLAGSCVVGTPVDCDDAVACTVDSCDEGADSCVATPDDSLCDNGDFCDGAESCDPVLDCQGGSDPCPGQSCDESGDFCFTPFLLSVGHSGAGTGTVTSTPAGIDCGTDCSELYPETSVVALAAASDPDSAFAAWGGDPDCADGSVTMTAPTSCTATFDCTSAGQLVDEPIADVLFVHDCQLITGGANLEVQSGATVTFEAPVVVLEDGATLAGDFVAQTP